MDVIVYKLNLVVTRCVHRHSIACGSQLCKAVALHSMIIVDVVSYKLGFWGHAWVVLHICSIDTA